MPTIHRLQPQQSIQIKAIYFYLLQKLYQKYKNNKKKILGKNFCNVFYINIVHIEKLLLNQLFQLSSNIELFGREKWLAYFLRVG